MAPETAGPVLFIFPFVHLLHQLFNFILNLLGLRTEYNLYRTLAEPHNP
jgi:hypothetical protein